MIRPGDVLENAVSGERLVFHETSASTNGERLRYEALVRPHGLAAYEHLHPRQDEVHEVLEGELRMVIDGEETVLRAGESTTIPAGVRHKAVGTGGEVRVMMELRPALRWEELFETWAALARDGKIGKRGYPNPLQAAVLAHEYREEVYAAWPPLPLQKALTAVLAPVGKLLGYRAPYASSG
jgi:mannose-6-phosphate isomerase-like protein (cupin superfamily)